MTAKPDFNHTRARTSQRVKVLTRRHTCRPAMAARALVAVVLVVASLTACDSKESGCAFKRPKIIVLTGALAAQTEETLPEAGARPRPKPKPTKTTTKQRKKNCSKQNSPIWKGYQNAKNSWKTDGTYYYKWDDLHNDIEKYDRRGRHQGSVDPSTGTIYRGPQPRHDLPKSKRDW